MLEPLAREFDAYVINSVICEEIGIDERSPADVAIVRAPQRVQKPKIFFS